MTTLKRIQNRLETAAEDSLNKFKGRLLTDAKGLPLMLFHGTDTKFTQFTDFAPNFFTPSKRYAAAYQNKKRSPMRVYLAMEHPFDPRSDSAATDLFNDEYLPYMQQEFPTLVDKVKPLKPGDPLPFTYADNFWPYLRGLHRKGKCKYDGIVVYEGNSMGPEASFAFVPLHAAQIIMPKATP